MISIHPRRLLRALALFVLGLTVVNLAVQTANFFLGYPNLWGLTRLFDVNEENNIPTWYSSTALLICGILLWLISETKRQRGDRHVKHWRGLSVIFLLLSLDETASLHDLFNSIGFAINASGFFFFIWVIPGAVFVLSILLVYWKFLMQLPAKTRYLIFAAGIIYVFGALGLEMISGNYFDLVIRENLTEYSSGWNGMSMALFLAVEEFLEMLGVLIFIAALLSYISADLQDIHARFSPEFPKSNPKGLK
ncbi:MAG: hypothetical protein Kow00121_68170 [Elainellaceae cyanobacterium]